ncbi:MAG: AAA family ATPase [Candidatus Omnitrophica bacterium]|nr:AAA family ATPase [Candidatus Omnitrophota bacterium]
MKLREIFIKNFRCLKDMRMSVTDTCVLIGENNSGKTALLEAIRIVLTRASYGKNVVFDEYDYYMSKAGDSPLSSEGIEIELWFREDKSDEWPESLSQSLQDIIQTDPIKDIDSIGIRLSSKADTVTKTITPRVEFLSIDGQVLKVKASNVTAFLTYIRIFALSALRDADEEFSVRSQYWGKFLKDLKISDEQRRTLGEDLLKINKDLLKADPRLEKFRSSFANAQKIMAFGDGSNTSIQAVPLKPWDLMSKSEVVIKPKGSDIDIPLLRHGQGIQSLTVLFLFYAYIEILLKPSFESETEAILTLEEPEAHLHPQAIRALAANLCELKTQKIISSHSPHFIQEIPFQDIRLFRRGDNASNVYCIKRSFSVKLPVKDGLENFCSQSSAKYHYDSTTSILTLNGKMEESEYRSLLTMYSGETDLHGNLKSLYEESCLHLTDQDLIKLETCVKRIRGEILFARAWLLCEGQSEYPIVRYFSEVLGQSFDCNGIALIDYRNNGSAGLFVGLARIFAFPWLMLCDTDEQGKNSIKEVKNRGVSDDQIKTAIRLWPNSCKDLEEFLIKNGFVAEYAELITGNGNKLKNKPGDAEYGNEILALIRKDKVGYAYALISKLRGKNMQGDRVPDFLSALVKDSMALGR